MNMLQSSFRYGFLFCILVLATVCKGEPILEIDERVEDPAGMIAKVKEEARKQRPEEIRKIWVGMLRNPRRPFGTHVEYEPERFETYAILKTFVAEIPGEPTEKYYTHGYGFRFKDEPFTEARILTEILRVFPLKQTTVFLRLEDDLTYKEVLALLLALEDGTLKQPKPITLPNGEIRALFRIPLSKSDLPKIIRVEKGKDGIRISTHERGSSGGHSFTIQEKDGGYIVISSGFWWS